MNELEALREQFRGDRFATEQAGITISEAREGYALCEMPLTPLHRNARGTPMGGAIFTLADFAFALASNCEGEMIVSLENSISFIAPPKGKITATATVYKKTGKIAFCDVVVHDERERLVAKMSVCGYRKGINLPIE